MLFRSGEVADAIHFLAQKIGMECNGASAGINLRDDVSGELSLNWGTMEADENKMSLVINYRYPVTFGHDDCAPAFNKLFTDAGFALDREFHKEKLYIPEDHELVTTLLDVYHEQTGREGKAICIGGGTYAKAIPNILACGPINGQTGNTNTIKIEAIE